MLINGKELKEIIWKKWIFPDFSNKLTWMVGGAGVTILLTPTPLKQITYNWLVDTYSLNSGEHYTLAELQSGTVDYWFGFGVIALALLHNVVHKAFICKADKLAWMEKQELIEVDRKLFNEFVSLLPSDGLDVKLLEKHDFGNSHNGKSVKALAEFVHGWDNAQKQFLDTELESKRSDLIIKSKYFIHTLASRSYAIGNGEFFSCIPDLYRGAWEWPVHVDEQIRELNELGTELFELHKELILTARRKLKC